MQISKIKILAVMDNTTLPSQQNCSTLTINEIKANEIRNINNTIKEAQPSYTNKKGLQAIFTSIPKENIKTK
jgi:hypothetical protein